MRSMSINNCYSCLRISVMVEFGLFLFPRSQKIHLKTKKNKKKMDQSAHIFHFGGDWVCFLGGWNRTITVLARTTRNCPWRMNTPHEQQTSIIYLRHVCTHSVSKKMAGSHGIWFAPPHTPSYYHFSPKAWPVWRGHANARLRRRPAKSCGGWLAGCRCNIDDTAVRCGLSST